MIKVIGLAVLMFILYVFLTGWALMMAVGIIHAEWITACPTLGFKWACIIAFFIRLAFWTISRSGD